MISMKEAQDHPSREMKGILGEMEDHPFQVMNMIEGFLFHPMNKIEGLLGLMMQDHHSQGTSNIQGIIGMEGQGMEMLGSHLSSGLMNKQV